jgi:hypothetical protein
MKQSAWFIVVCVILLPGCRGMRWAQEHFVQGQEVAQAKPARDIVRDNVRSAYIYHEFETAGIFDVLFLSPAVRQAYVDTYAAKHLLSREAKEKMEHEQHNDFAHNLSFIVMGYMPENSMPIGDDKSLWSIVLQGTDKILKPRSSKSYELNPEYEYFLKDKVSKHKYVYLVKFDAITEHGQATTSSEMELTLATVSRKVTLRWPGDCFDSRKLPGPRGVNC